MKLTAQCFPCLVSKAASQLEKAGIAEDDVILGILKVTRVMLDAIENPDFKKEFGINIINPAAVGSIRNNFILKYVNKDPYKEEKKHAEDIAIKAVQKMGIINNTMSPITVENIVYWLRLIAIANSLEFDLEHLGNNPVKKFSMELEKASRTGLNIQFEEKAIKVASKIIRSNSIVFLTDNAGEHVLDMLFAQFLLNNGKKVIVAAKRSPTQNDATINDLEKTKEELQLSIDVTHTGSSTVGLFVAKVSRDFLNLLIHSDFIIAKGMGHFESFNSVNNIPFKGVIVYKAKCEPVAKASKLKKGEYNISPINLTL